MEHSSPEGGRESIQHQPPAKELQSPVPTPSIRLETWISLGLLVLTLLAYSRVVGFKFVSFDDPLYLTANPTIQGGLTWKSLQYAFTSGSDGGYLPLVWLSHATCVSLFGAWAGGHHLVNLLLHAANSILLFLFLNRITKSARPSAIVAALFALHPLHVESVAWISERKDVLSTLFWILASMAYVRYTEKPSLRRYLRMALLFTLGLLSKSMLVTLPLTLLLFDIWPLHRFRWEDSWAAFRTRAFGFLVLEKVPLLALSAASAVATLRTQKAAGALASLNLVPVHLRFGNAAITLTEYLRQMVWPWNLTFFYPFPTQLHAGRVAASLAIALGITVICLLYLRRRPVLAVGWFWYLITLLPVVGLVQVGSQAHADRYTYVPLIGIFLMLGWLVEEYLPHWHGPRVVLPLAAAACLGILFTLTTIQTGAWRDSESLWRHDLALNPNNVRAYIGLGDEAMKRGRFQEAFDLYGKAKDLSPNHESLPIKRGYVLELMGRDAEALALYQSCQTGGKITPLVLDQRIGAILTRMERFEEAVPHVLRGTRLASDFGWIPGDAQGSRIDWAAILRSRNRLPEAARTLEAVVAAKPESARAWTELGRTFLQMGRPEEALGPLEKAAKLNPKDPQVLYWLGTALIKLDRLPEASRIFESLGGVAPHSPLSQKGMLELKCAQGRVP